MNEELKKAIEVAKSLYRQKVHQERIVDNKSYFDSVDIALAVDYGANFVYSKWQEAERWRKVEEELPEVDDEGVSIPVLVKTKYGGHVVARYHKKCDDFVASSISITGVIRWKPIN